MRYVIQGPLNDDKECMFWNNDDGWCGLESATIFTDKQRMTLRAPVEALHWVGLPKVK